MKIQTLVIAAFAAAAGASQAAPAFIDFDATPIASGLGAVTGGADPRTPGVVDQFWLPDNAATSGEVRAGVGRAGSNGLVVGNRGNGNDGVIDNLKTGRLAQAAGEASVAPFDTFESSYWFRTAGAGAPAQGNFRFRSESYGSDRNTFLGFQNDAAGALIAIAFDVDAGGNFVQTSVASGLSWATWYQVTTRVQHLAGAANDIVTHTIVDELGNTVATATLGTWEEGQRQLGFNGGSLVALDAVQFHARGAATGDVAYVDDVRWNAFSSAQAVPEPATLALAGLALAAAGLARRRG